MINQNYIRGEITTAELLAPVKNEIQVDLTAVILLTELSQLILQMKQINYELQRDANAMVLPVFGAGSQNITLDGNMYFADFHVLRIYSPRLAKGRPLATTNIGRVIVYCDTVRSFTQFRQILGQYVNNTMPASFRTI